MRDSAGIRIAESRAADPAGAPTVAATRRLDIGASDGAPETLFARITAALRLRDGTIVVADGGANVVRVFDGAGRHIRSFGAPGDGPFEYRSIAALHSAPGDTLVVFDSRHLRTSWIALDDGRGREVSLSPRQSAVTGIPLSDGSLLSVAPPPPRPGGGAGQAEAAAVVRYDAAGTLRDTIALVPGPRMHMLAMGPGRFGVVFVPYSGNSWVAVRNGAIVLGTAETCELRTLDVDGALTGVTRWPCELGLDAEDVDRWRRHMLQRAEANGPAAVEQTRTMIDQVTIPERCAAYGAFRVAPDGSIWLPEVTLPGEDPVHWTVLDAEGRLLGGTTVPERFLPLDIGDDWVLGRWRDELDVQHLRLYDLERR